jgi:hypothetical protein
MLEYKINNDFSIAVAHHNTVNYPLLESPYISICNAEGGQKPPGFEIYDVDFSDNISSKNKTYCELSVLYSLWKQELISDTFGLAHYRRLFCLDNTYGSFDVVVKSFSERHDFALRQLQYMKDYNGSVIVGYTGLVGGSIWNQFKITHPDLFPFFAYASEKFGLLYPEMQNPISFFQNNAHLNHCNMFIAPKEVVNHWCSIIFNFLENIEAEAPKELDPYSMRWAGFFSERFFTYFINSIQDKINVLIKPIILFE